MDYIETIIPLASFKARLSDWLEMLVTNKNPILVTRYGKGAFVVQDVESYAKILRLARQAHFQVSLQNAHNHYDEERDLLLRQRGDE